MKRVLWFVALFAAGLALLRVFRGSGPGVAGDDAAGRRAPEWAEEDPDALPGLTPSGALVVRQYLEADAGGRRPTRFQLDAEDSGSGEDGAIYFTGVQVRYLDPDTSAERMRLEAARAVATRVAGGEGGFDVRLEREVRLYDVVATVYDGAPVVPLEIVIPELVVDTEARTLASDDPVSLSGPGLVGEGVGLFVDEPGRLLRIERDGSLRLDGYAGAGGTLEAADALVVRRPADGDAQALEVRASGAARLAPVQPEGAPPPVPPQGLSAGEILLSGHDDPELGMAVTAIDAWRAEEGGAPVRYAQGEHRLSGGRAHVDLDAAGEPTFARMTEEPRATLVVDRAALGTLGAGEEAPEDGRAGIVRVHAADALELRWREDGVHFSAGGPARFVGEDAVLFSDGPADGVVLPDGRGASFACGGGVRLEARTATLVAETLEAEVGRDDDGASVMHVRADGRPLVTGTSKDGRDVTLAAEGALELERREGRWTVPRAEEVALTVLGPDGLHARAELVEDFDPRRVALTATGNVDIETAEGIATGATLDVTSRETFTLAGDEEERAAFQSPDGDASARSIEREGDAVTLRGDVVAHLVPTELGGEVYDVECDVLTLSRAESEEGGEAVRVFHLDAEGVRRAAVRRGGESLDLVCAELDGRYREVLDADGRPVERFSSFQADDVERAVLERGGETTLGTRVRSEELGATRLQRYDGGELVQEEGEAVARGDVVFHGSANGTPFSGTAHEVRVDRDGALRAVASEGEKVFVSGNLPSNGKPYELEALSVRATPDELGATEPELVVLSMQAGADGETDVDIHARAKTLSSTRDWLELDGDVHVDGLTEEAMPWRLDAGRARFEGDLRPGQGVRREDVSALHASRGVRLELPEHDIIATGETLRAKRLSGIMRVEGVPARISSPTLVNEAEWLEFDVDLGILVGSGRGEIRGREEEDASQDAEEDEELVMPTVRYASLSPLFEADTLIYVLEEPRIVYEGADLRVFLPVMPTGDVTISASWAILWVDRRRIEDLPERLDDGAEAPVEDGAADVDAGEDDEDEGIDRIGAGARLIERVQQFGIIKEAYLEGPVELAIEDQPTATASAVYLDVVSGNGWIADASFAIPPEVLGREVSPIRVRARWLRQSDDGSFHADEAKVALCEFEDPHLLITTRDLRITPHPTNPDHYDVVLRDNEIRMYDRVTLPLPSIDWTTDERGRPILSTLKLGSSARFGSFVSAGVVRPATGAANFLHDLIGRASFDVEGPDANLDGVPDIDIDGEYSVDASWLGSRGVLLDGGFIAEAQGQYWWSSNLGGIPDGDEDKGFLRVDEDDRDTLRLWARTQARYLLGEEEWVDVVGTWQTDPGVQAEFFEDEFVRYELAESFVRWRKARDEYFVSATGAAHLDDFQSRIEELPALRAWRGRAEVASLGPLSFLYDASAEAARLDRIESDGGYASPFGQPAVFPDGLGERDVVRFDTTHRLEAPFSLGAAGLRATPFLLGRFTAWSEDQAEEDEPTRAFGQAGVRVATPLWKRSSSGALHQLVPYAAARADVAHETDGGSPVPFDGVEEPLEGRFVDLGLRSRVSGEGGRTRLDLDVRATNVSDVPSGAETGWTELGFFGRLNVAAFDVPLQISHDGRYDVEAGDTLYSRVMLGVRPTDALGFEAGHHRGLDLDRERLYEAASIHGLYTWTPKWEFEGRQTFSLLEDGDRLGSAVTLRRYGHDLVFEIETAFRQGEGTSFGVSVRPRFTFDRPDVGGVSF